jgi:hypothetical protein
VARNEVRFVVESVSMAERVPPPGSQTPDGLIIKLQNPGISNKEIKALIRAGIYPKRFPVEPVQVDLPGNWATWSPVRRRWQEAR